MNGSVRGPAPSEGRQEETQTRDERFRKRERIRLKHEFAKTLRGNRIEGGLFTLHVRRIPRPPSRLGLIVTRKVGCAVERNRVKRRLREVFRRSKGCMTAPVDAVVRAHPAIRHAAFGDIEAEWRRALVTMRLWNGGRGGNPPPAQR